MALCICAFSVHSIYYINIKLRKQDEDKLSGGDTLPMKSLLKLDDEKDNLNKTGSKSDDDILKPPRDEDDPDRLGFDGNYLKPKIESDI